MSWEAARDLSIPDLLRALNEKLGLEYIRLQKTSNPRTVSVAFLELEVSEPQSTYLTSVTAGFDCICRSKVWKPKHGMS